MATIPFRRRKIPYTFFNANYVIMGITGVVFLISLLNSYISENLALSVQGLESGRIWQLFTYFFAFVGDAGSSILHLVFSLLVLLFFGTQVEREMGSIQYLLYYVLIGALSGLAGVGLMALAGADWLLLHGPSITVFAVAVAFAGFYPDSIIYLMGIIPLRAALLVVIYVVIDIVSLVLTQGLFSLVHLLGFVIAYAWMLIRYRRNIFRNLFG